MALLTQSYNRRLRPCVSAPAQHVAKLSCLSLCACLSLILASAAARNFSKHSGQMRSRTTACAPALSFATAAAGRLIGAAAAPSTEDAAKNAGLAQTGLLTGMVVNLLGAKLKKSFSSAAGTSALMNF